MPTKSTMQIPEFIHGAVSTTLESALQTT